MKKVLLGVLLGALAIYAYDRVRAPARVATVERVGEWPASAEPASSEPVSRSSGSTVATEFRCDGRVYCSQMTSCEEATFFLENCPGVKMDGEGDGVPCESQWCGRH